jgi:hypothetical protein
MISFFMMRFPLAAGGGATLDGDNDLQDRSKDGDIVREAVRCPAVQSCALSCGGSTYPSSRHEHGTAIAATYRRNGRFTPGVV